MSVLTGDCVKTSHFTFIFERLLTSLSDKKTMSPTRKEERTKKKRRTLCPLTIDLLVVDRI